MVDRFRSDDPYEILGVPRNAARGDIKRAFRKLAKEHHPDRNQGDPEAARLYARISRAHDLLIDPERRAAYDQGLLRPEWVQEEGAGAEAQFRRRDASQRFRTHGADLHYELALDFFEAFHGVRKRVKASDGAVFELIAPPGTREGDVIRLHGQGEASGIGGRYGDAFVAISLRPHAVFALSGDDVCRDLKVGLREAVFGAKVEVETPDGPARVEVPARSNSGDVLRIRGRGFPKRNGKERGDLLMKILVMLPEGRDAALERYLREGA